MVHHRGAYSWVPGTIASTPSVQPDLGPAIRQHKLIRLEIDRHHLIDAETQKNNSQRPHLDEDDIRNINYQQILLIISSNKKILEELIVVSAFTLDGVNTHRFLRINEHSNFVCAISHHILVYQIPRLS